MIYFSKGLLRREKSFPELMPDNMYVLGLNILYKKADRK